MPIDTMTQLRSDVIKRNVDTEGRDTLRERVSDVQANFSYPRTFDIRIAFLNIEIVLQFIYYQPDEVPTL